MSYTLGFIDKACTALELAGGKGANLARMTQKGFPVPPGFVVTERAYWDFLSGDAELSGEISGFVFGDPGRLRAQSEALRARLALKQLPEALVLEVRERLGGFDQDVVAGLCPDITWGARGGRRGSEATGRSPSFISGQAFSVRSSSTMEDLAGAAFAGQHDTYLNCLGEAEILRRIRDCFLSLWMDRAIAYRHEQGFDHRKAAMAVVVQKMVRCDVAGVGFSVNPIGGDLGEMIVDANFGLGESVVNGEGEVDHWIIDKKTLLPRETHIAQKTIKVVCGIQGTEDVHLSEAEGQIPALQPSELEQVARLLVSVEESYRFPQDIEWGIEAGVLYLLQSRPITTIPPHWTRDESAERFPTVITPLTWDFVEDGFHQSLKHSLHLMGFPPFNGQWFGLHGHYVYGNQNAVHLYLSRSPLEVRSVEDLIQRLPAIRHDFRWVQELPLQWSRELDHYLLTIGELMAEQLEPKSMKEVWDFVLTVNKLGADYFLPNIAISITHGSLFRFLHWFLATAVGREKAPPLFDALLAWCETKTGVINRELSDMAQQIHSEPALAELMASRTSREIVESQALSAFPIFQARFAKFLRDHGHREIEFDAYHPTWVEAPWVVLDNLRLMVGGPEDQDPVDKEAQLKARMQQVEFEVYGKLPVELRYFFSEILRLARVYTSLDDLEHYQTTRLTLPMRKGLLELGRRLVLQGVIEEPMDVYFARRELLDRTLRADDPGLWKELAAAIRTEKWAYIADRDRTPEWILGQTQTAQESTGDFLKGLPGSPGVAEGPVYRVLSSEDFAHFPKGAVLVARTTNPTWTPLFYSAAAVVTESGGPLSHGAVTAREMKIPAVMSVRDCLSRLQNGQRVRVEGIEGRVVLL